MKRQQRQNIRRASQDSTQFPAISSRTRITSMSIALSNGMNKSQVMMPTESQIIRTISQIEKDQEIREKYPQLTILKPQLISLDLLKKIQSVQTNGNSKFKHIPILSDMKTLNMNESLIIEEKQEKNDIQEKQNFDIFNIPNLPITRSISQMVLPSTKAKHQIKPNYEKQEYMVRFKPYIYKFESFQEGAIQKSTKNQFDQAVKQSTNLVTSEQVREVRMFDAIFRKIEKQQNELIFQSENLQKDFGNSMTNLHIRKLNLLELIDYLLNLFEKNELQFDQAKVVFDAFKEQTIKTRSIYLYFLIEFIYSIYCQAFGQLEISKKVIQGLLEFANVYQIYELKIPLYYTYAICCLGQRLTDKTITYAKKLLKYCWYFKHHEYENKAYHILSRVYFQMQLLEESKIFNQRYFDYKHQTGYIQQLGIQFLRTDFQIKKVRSKKYSLSYDDFDLNLIITEEQNEQQQAKLEKPPPSPNKHDRVRNNKIMASFHHKIGKKQIFKKLKGECDLCAQFINGQKIVLDQEVHYHHNCFAQHHQSNNRDFQNYFSEQSKYLRKDNLMNQIYKPQKTVPILKKILNIFKDAYLVKISK